VKVSKRERAAKLIEAGGATRESLKEELVISDRALDTLFSTLRLTGRYPNKKGDGTYEIVDKETFEQLRKEEKLERERTKFLNSKKFRKAEKAVMDATQVLKTRSALFKASGLPLARLYMERAKLDLDIAVMELNELKNTFEGV
jgi:hypothetical protein